MPARIFLVGFMGAGKTTIGRLLADRLGWSFVDLDAEVERREGRSVADIFASVGESCFRSMETESLRAVSGPGRSVIALGGGTYIDAANRSLVDSLGTSVYLDAPFDALFGRIEDDGSRPLAGSRSEMELLFAERVASYKMARMRVDVASRAPEDIVNEVLRGLEDS